MATPFGVNDWCADIDEDKPDCIEVKFHVWGVNKPEIFVTLFSGVKKALNLVAGSSVWAWAINMALEFVNLFKKSK